MSDLESNKEFTLDPDNWDDVRNLGHQMLDDMFDFLQSVRDRPVWVPITDEMKQNLEEPLPTSPQDRVQIYKEFKDKVLPYGTGQIHPRFWGWVNGTGSVFGMLAEMLAAGMNTNTGGREHMPKYFEHQVLSWAKEMMEFPADASATLTSGCSMANLIALTVARNLKAGVDIRKEGLQNLPKNLIYYTSTAMHSSIQKALEIIGIGSNQLRVLDVDANYNLKLDLLESAIESDLANNQLPICVIANVGTVNTGAVDNLIGIREIADRYNLWMHIDGAFGAIANLSPKYKHLVANMNLADSLAFDFHKWMYMPYTVACVIIKKHDDHLNSFSLRPAYLAEATRGLASGGRWPTEYGIQLSRTFYALKVWFMLKENGMEKYGQLITQNIEQARYMQKLISSNNKLEQLAPVYLNVVCFRYTDPNLPDSQLNELNEELLIQLQENGLAAPSNTTINGKFALRMAITNHRSRYEDFDFTVNKIIELGDKLIHEKR